MVRLLGVNLYSQLRINIKEEVLKSIEVKGKVDECQKPDSKHVSSYYWCQIFDKQ